MYEILSKKFKIKYIIKLYVMSMCMYLLSELLLWGLEFYIISSIIWLLSNIVKMIGVLGSIFYSLNVWCDKTIDKRIVIKKILLLIFVFFVCQYLPSYLLSFFNLEITG